MVKFMYDPTRAKLEVKTVSGDPVLVDEHGAPWADVFDNEGHSGRGRPETAHIRASYLVESVVLGKLLRTLLGLRKRKYEAKETARDFNRDPANACRVLAPGSKERCLDMANYMEPPCTPCATYHQLKEEGIEAAARYKTFINRCYGATEQQFPR